MKRNSESGIALLSAILVLMLMSAILVGFIAMVSADQNASGINRDQTQAYAAAHAATEKLTTDLGQLFQANFSPTGAQVQALVAAGRQPNLGNGTSYVAPGGVAGSGYVIEYDDVNPADGNPDLENATGSQITDGVYAGLMGLITPYRMVVTARTPGGSEVRMRRDDADRGHPGLPVRHLLGERPQLLRRSQLQLRRPRPHQSEPVSHPGRRQRGRRDAHAVGPRHRGRRDRPRVLVER